MRNEPDELTQLEEAIRAASEGHFVLKLYVTGSSPRSSTAVSNLKNICEMYLPGRYELEIIDIYQQPELAAQNQLLAAPTLVKESPYPMRRLVGDMSDEDRVLYSLNVHKPA